jgi:hypothetical protein
VVPREAASESIALSGRTKLDTSAISSCQHSASLMKKRGLTDTSFDIPIWQRSSVESIIDICTSYTVSIALRTMSGTYQEDQYYRSKDPSNPLDLAK